LPDAFTDRWFRMVSMDRRLAGLAVADDQLALAAADGGERVDDLEPRVHRLADRLARDDAGGLDVHPAPLGDVGDRALVVDRLAERIHHTAQEALAHRHVDDLAQATDLVALADRPVLAEDDDADVVALQVQRHAFDAGLGELDHLAGLDLIEAVDAGDAVADREHLADVGDIGFLAEVGDLGLQDGRNLGRANVHGS
jgi:hypothetical protein